METRVEYECHPMDGVNEQAYLGETGVSSGTTGDDA